MTLASATSWALYQARHHTIGFSLSPFISLPSLSSLSCWEFPNSKLSTLASFFPCAGRTLFLLSPAFKLYSPTNTGNKSFLVFLTKLGTINTENFNEPFSPFFVYPLPFRDHSTESAYKMAMNVQKNRKKKCIGAISGEKEWNLGWGRGFEAF